MKFCLFISAVLTCGLLLFERVALAQNNTPQVLPRENIDDFIQDDKKLQALKRGVDAMKQKPATDRTSWLYQSYMHGKMNDQGTDLDTSDPSYNQCQHFQWWFLAWHRGYLYFFERILQNAAGDPTLRIPYWDYSKRGDRAIPPPFVEQGSPLNETERNLQSGQELSPTVVDDSTAMGDVAFVGTTATGGFGSASVPQPVQFNDGVGDLEQSPHNNVHNAIGGKMGDPTRAAQDPIFWLHHSNIDRLWELWLSQGNGRNNPKDREWLDAEFTFYDESGSENHVKVRDLLDTTKLGYTYPGVTPITGAPPGAQRLGAASPKAEEKLVSESSIIPKVKISAFALEQPEATSLTISDGAATVNLKIAETDPKLALMAPGLQALPKKTRIVLTLEDIHFDKVPNGVFEVYLNLPTADYATAGQTRHFVGTFSFFEPPVVTRHHGLAKRKVSLNITKVVNRLKQETTWDPANMQVTVVPAATYQSGKPIKPELNTVVKVDKISVAAVTEEGQ